MALKMTIGSWCMTRAVKRLVKCKKIGGILIHSLHFVATTYVLVVT